MFTENSRNLKTTPEFEEKFKYSTQISKILIANNGIAALKFIRSIRQWCYNELGNERAISFVAMVTREDLDAHAEYALLADELISVPSGPSTSNYGNVHLIVELAQDTPVQAVWAGWGHASENPNLPELLSKVNIIFLGPTANSMWLLGDKIASTLIAQTLNIPTLPWSGSDIILEKANDAFIYNISSSIYDECCVKSCEDLNAIITHIGLPVMVKASGGGGGKGIRKINQNTDYDRILRQISTEVPESPIFAVKLLKMSRHVEIQLIGDHYSNVISLFSRDCTIQRRHQKIIEEAPAIISPEHVLRKMESDAIALAKSVGYVGTGTVEYLYDPITEKYYFLELNPRLQVEHPCTEIIANVNLPACQLEVAVGRSLFEIEDLRHFTREFKQKSDLMYPPPPVPLGHVISVRITAENAEEGFRPSSGSIKQLNFRNGKNIWGYFSIHSGGRLHQYADSQFGHLFACGQSREEARKSMVLALKELSVHGEIRTTIDFLVTILEHTVFRTNSSNTEWLDDIKDTASFISKPSLKVIIFCAATCIAHQRATSILLDYKVALEKGQVPKSNCLVESINIDFIYELKQFKLTATRSAENSFLIIINNTWMIVEIYHLGNQGRLVIVDNQSYTCFLSEEISHYILEIGTIFCTLYKDFDPTILRSPSSGKLVTLLVKDNDLVLKGSDFAEIEVMKMVMPLTVPESGHIHFSKSSGAILEAGTVIAKIILINPPRDCTSLFVDDFSAAASFRINSPPSNHSSQSSISSLDELRLLNNVNRKNFKVSYLNLSYIMDGFCLPEPHFSRRLEQDLVHIVEYLAEPTFVSTQLKTSLNSIKHVLPKHIYNSIFKHINQYSVNSTSIFNEIPTLEISSLVDTHAQLIESTHDRQMFYSDLAPFLNLTDKLKNGINFYKLSILVEFLSKYLNVETHFNRRNFEHSVRWYINSSFNDITNPNFYDTLMSIIFSHANVANKNILVLKIIDVISEYTKLSNDYSDTIKYVMSSLANLYDIDHLKVALRAKQFLIESFKPSFQLRHNQLESIFLSMMSNSSQKSLKILQDVIHSDGVIIDILPTFFFASNSFIQRTALEIYIRHSYVFYNLVQLNHCTVNHLPIVKFFFTRHTTPHSYPQNTPSADATSAINKIHCGIMTCVTSFDELLQHFYLIISLFENSASQFNHTVYDDKIDSCVINICISVDYFNRSLQDEYADICYRFVSSQLDHFHRFKIRRITFLVTNCVGEMPFVYTFRAKSGYKEDTIFRHVEPATKYLLEINKMRNFNIECISCENPNIYMYFASSKSQSSNVITPDNRFFIRTIVRNSELISVEASFDYLVKASEVRLLEALDQLHIITSKFNKRAVCNHIFFNFTPCIVIDPQRTLDCIRMIAIRYGKRMLKQHVTQAEMKMVVLLEPGGEPIPLRLVISSDSGYFLNIDLYKEVYDSNIGKLIYHPFDTHSPGEFANLPIDTPYACLNALQSKRLQAHHLGSSYVYDFPHLFSLIICGQPTVSDVKGDDNTSNISHFQELETSSNDKLEVVKINKAPGENKNGVVCWHAHIRNRTLLLDIEVLVVANDVTVCNGSFSSHEAIFFKAACIYARKHSLPLIYLCCSSGARIGLAEEVKDCYRVAWKNDECPEKGVDYLYVDESDFQRLSASNSIEAEAVVVDGTIRYKLTTIFGEKHGIGVENLTGSGMIAGEMARCFDEIFTISFVTGKAVGIGAYLVRLGHRVVQSEKSSIILTGAEALNRVLGRKIYTSHDQLGGVEIMYRNGVSQIVASDDLDGISHILKWLSYYNTIINKSLRVTTKIVEIGVDSFNENDPRNLIYGYFNKNNHFLQGFFDLDSIFEINSGWSQTVITGRARLNGIPCAYIMNDIKLAKSVSPVDPADPNDVQRDSFSVGQVMSPESSFKFSQSIDDANHESLPLFIFANFRGFSAGMKDMYNQVLKFGAMIVESLRIYKNPVFIYLLPNGELRGGSWAVLDTEINPDFIEMYSSETSNANILEPSALVAIKYRTPEIIKTMDRINELSKSKNRNISDEIKQDMIKVYCDVAERFAKLHDTPQRMLHKKVIKAIVPWRESRRFFYLRLRRRLIEMEFASKISRIDKNLDYKHILTSLYYQNSTGSSFEDDEQFADWLELQLMDSDIGSPINKIFSEISKTTFFNTVQNHIQSNPHTLHQLISSLLSTMSSDQKQEITQIINNFTN